MSKLLSDKYLAKMREHYIGLSARCGGQTIQRLLVGHIEALLEHIDAMGRVCHTPEFREHLDEEEAVHLPSNDLHRGGNDEHHGGNDKYPGAYDGGMK